MDNRFNEYQNEKRAFMTDLASERHRADTSVNGIFYRRDDTGPFVWERIDVTTREGEIAIDRPRGSYDSLSVERMDLLDESEIADAANEVASELCRMFEKSSVTPTRILVVGLGNEDLTPDSIGPKSANLVNATMHIQESDPLLFKSLECSEIAVFTPGVMGKTGIETSEAVSAVCDVIDPDAVIAIDSIASRSPERLGTTIQISNTGIFPGSGIGNKRKPIGEKTLGVPVIAVGVPTVINASAFIPDERHARNENEDMFVSPRDIDAIVDAAAKIISQGINQAFGVF